jgi:hypothetical protein
VLVPPDAPAVLASTHPIHDDQATPNKRISLPGKLFMKLAENLENSGAVDGFIRFNIWHNCIVPDILAKVNPSQVIRWGCA